MEDPVAEAVQNRAHRGERLGGGRRHDGKLRGFRTHDPAGDGRIDEPATRGSDPFGDGRDRLRRTGGHQHDRCPGREGIEAALGEQHVLGLGRIHDHEQDRIGTGCGLGHGVGLSAPGGGEGRPAFRTDVVPADIETRAQEMPGHGHPHGSEADEGDACHSHVRMLRLMASDEMP